MVAVAAPMDTTLATTTSTTTSDSTRTLTAAVVARVRLLPLQRAWVKVCFEKRPNTFFIFCLCTGVNVHNEACALGPLIIN